MSIARRVLGPAAALGLLLQLCACAPLERVELLLTVPHS